MSTGEACLARKTSLLADRTFAPNRIAPIISCMTSTNFRIHTITAIGLILFSFLMAALLSRTVFERVPHLEDEVAYLYQARIFARGDVVIDIPQPRRAYWQPFVVDYNETGKRFGKYSPGWPLLLAVGVNLGQPWVLNAFFAALTVALVYRLGQEIFDEDTGLIAAALTAFSPMALLLNATLMGHTAALFFFTLFMYAYWRIEKHRQVIRWAAVAGIALGLLVINRPLTAVGIAAPFILWSGLKLVRPFVLEVLSKGESETRPYDSIDEYGVGTQRAAPLPTNTHVQLMFLSTLRPLVVIAVITLLISTVIPLFNAAATGDPTKNLYTLVWEYDRVGFGSCCGRSSQNPGDGHNILKGVRHARFDLSLMAADLFGWQISGITQNLREHLLNASDYYPAWGFSFFLLPLGLLVGFRENWLRAWMIGGMFWLLIPLVQNSAFLIDSQQTTWLWLGVFIGWLLIPPLVFAFSWTKHHPTSQWTWLLLAVVVGLIGVHLAYWVGSQRYSTRYYFEALSALALLSALPIAWLARRTHRGAVYGIFGVLLLWSLFNYSIPRIEVLYRFNQISTEVAQEVQDRAEDDRPILVMVNGEVGNVRWRSLGPLMVVTSPHLDSDIVVAWNYDLDGDSVRQQILDRFPDRQVIEMQAAGNEAWFIEPCTPGAGLAGIHDCINNRDQQDS